MSLAATLRRPLGDAAGNRRPEGERVRIRDIGLGGACVEAQSFEQPLRLEAQVVLEVTAPTLWDPLVLRGRVAWLRQGRADEPSRFGVRFDHAEQGGLFALFHLLGASTFDA